MKFKMKRGDLVEVGLFGGLIFSLASLTSSGSRLLSSSLGVYLGEVSFAVYMVCIPWELAFTKAAHQLLGKGGPLDPGDPADVFRAGIRGDALQPALERRGGKGH